MKDKGGAKTDRGRELEKESRETVQSGPGRVPGSPQHPLFTHRDISDNFTAPLSATVEKGTDSFLVTHPLSSESGCYHGKIQTFGILSG